MNKRENLISVIRRQGVQEVPVEFSLCPSLVEEYDQRTQADSPYPVHFGFSSQSIRGLSLTDHCTDQYREYYRDPLKPGTYIDEWGVAHEPGSKEAMHMTRMRHPLQEVLHVEELMAYPFPDFANADGSHLAAEVEEIHNLGLAAVGNMQCTIWETAWYMRSMNELMIDMMMEDPKAEYLLDRVTDAAVLRASAFAKAGADILFLGDDIGMQRTIMMRDGLYCTWLKPRLKRVIDAARQIKSDIIVYYHSCGYVQPLIQHLIEAGIDVLNPIQPECMDFREIHEQFGDKLSFHGTIGTQTTMPFGTPEDVRREVFKNLTIAGEKGGLLVCPTHILEPEVPWENILAYVEACRDFTR